MAKVYGICGDSKCRREVIPRNCFDCLTGQVTKSETVTVTLPDGWTATTTIITAIMFGVTAGRYDTSLGQDVDVELRGDKLLIKNRSTVTDYYFKIAIQRTSW